tara:strand:- start:2652 stop:2879 length:228 start_codon:yes stop_codon:yes gene_type:complete
MINIIISDLATGYTKQLNDLISVDESINYTIKSLTKELKPIELVYNDTKITIGINSDKYIHFLKELERLHIKENK